MIFENQKYKIGEIVDINSWSGLKKNFKIVDIDEIYHRRLGEYVCGYKVDREDETGLNYHFIPEGYLEKSQTQLRKDKMKRLIDEI